MSFSRILEIVEVPVYSAPDYYIFSLKLLNKKTVSLNRHLLITH